MSPIAVVAGARTPFVKSFTHLDGVSAVDLGTRVVASVLERVGCQPEEVDEVIFGNVASPPDAANIARVIALRSGVPHDRIAHTVNRNCGSGMESLVSAWQSLSLGRSRMVVAGGTESMSEVPFLWHASSAALWKKLARTKGLARRLSILSRLRPRHFSPVPGLKLGLTDPVCRLNMGETAELLARDFGIDRESQDAFACESHRRASAARKACFLSGEITSVVGNEGAEIPRDTAIRDEQTMEQLSRLKPLFTRRFEPSEPDWERSVTAGNSCPLTDGAAAVVLAKADDLARFDRAPLGIIRDVAIVGCDPKRMGLGPVFAIAKLLQRYGMRIEDVDAVEINEAFAAQVLACQRALDSDAFSREYLGRSKALGAIDPERLNIHGGAIAIGHPVGTTGTRLVMTLLRSLRKFGGRMGIASLCIGGGQGMAMLVEAAAD
ncbi:MAG: acetyl-CoA C-acyltransferase [Planctomycetota bacterium]